MALSADIGSLIVASSLASARTRGTPRSATSAYQMYASATIRPSGLSTVSLTIRELAGRISKTRRAVGEVPFSCLVEGAQLLICDILAFKVLTAMHSRRVNASRWQGYI
jgi:hypothetical protein